MGGTALAYSTMPQTLSNYKFLVYTNNETINRCNYFNETSVGNNHVKWNITRGCYLVHNCSQVVVHNQTRITIVNYQEVHYVSSDAQFDFKLGKDRMDKFVKPLEKSMRR